MDSIEKICRVLDCGADDILVFKSDFDAGTDIPDMMEVEFHVKSDKVVPNYILSLTQTGKLSSKEMTKTIKFDIVQDYVYSMIETFECHMNFKKTQRLKAVERIEI